MGPRSQVVFVRTCRCMAFYEIGCAGKYFFKSHKATDGIFYIRPKRIFEEWHFVSPAVVAAFL